MKQPPKWKFAVMVWIAIYPAITLLSYVLVPYLMELPIPLRTLIMTLVLVPTMVFLLLPFLRSILGEWLNR